MKLSTTWFTEPVFDFEYKKYQLLAYLQSKNEELNALRIYPHLTELNQHWQSLRDFQQNKDSFEGKLRKELEGIDPAQMELKYHQPLSLDQGLGEVMDIIGYSEQKIADCYRHFATEAEELRAKIKVSLDGLIPGYRKEGFLLIHQSKNSHLFSYALRPVITTGKTPDFTYHFIETYSSPKLFTETDLRLHILKKFRHEFDHPAIFTVCSVPDLPVYETLLPLSERELIKWVA